MFQINSDARANVGDAGERGRGAGDMVGPGKRPGGLCRGQLSDGDGSLLSLMSLSGNQFLCWVMDRGFLSSLVRGRSDDDRGVWDDDCLGLRARFLWRGRAGTPAPHYTDTQKW